MFIKNILLGVILVSINFTTYAESKLDKVNNADAGLTQFGFGPAFYMIRYNDKVFKDSKDVHTRGDGTISASGTNYATSLGLEAHYNIPLVTWRCCINPSNVWSSSSGLILSPFVGVFDIDRGMNGLAIGLVLGYWLGDENYEKKKYFNAGLGYAIHKDQLTLADGIQSGFKPSPDLKLEDYTTRKDVDGWTIVISTTIGF